MRRTWLPIVPVGLAVALAVSSVALASSAITPGTPKQVAALVAAAPSIATLPKGLIPPVAQASNDDPLSEYPSLAPCITGSTSEPACVFGDPKGSHTIVLFGDSHAYMWFPALDLIAKAAKWKLVALLNFGCPVADISVWDIVTNAPDTQCTSFRSHMITRIDALHPRLVVMSESFYVLNANDQTITDPEWTAALESSLTSLHATGMKKVLIGDTFLLPEPVACLSAYPTAVQTCSKPESNTTYTAQRAAEQKAAAAKKVVYVNEIPWTCSATCTAVIGDYVVYNSAGHLTATYATYLSGVLKLALKSSMR